MVGTGGLGFTARDMVLGPKKPMVISKHTREVIFQHKDKTREAYFLTPETTFLRHLQCLYLSRHPLGSTWGGLGFRVYLANKKQKSRSKQTESSQTEVPAYCKCHAKRAVFTCAPKKLDTFSSFRPGQTVTKYCACHTILRVRLKAASQKPQRTVNVMQNEPCSLAHLKS